MSPAAPASLWGWEGEGGPSSSPFLSGNVVAEAAMIAGGGEVLLLLLALTIARRFAWSFEGFASVITSFSYRRVRVISPTSVTCRQTRPSPVLWLRRLLGFVLFLLFSLVVFGLLPFTVTPVAPWLFRLSKKIFFYWLGNLSDLGFGRATD